ncbi:MAG: hypothetical protein HYY16_15220 [Planctomycetes bacterium]|nr:hypothetical protein [Planctomycetota bacterium]
MTLLLCVALCQDLMERSRASPDRLDLRVGPRVERTTTIAPGRIDLDLEFAPDLACGRFDLKGSFTSIFNKSVKDELVGALVARARSELAGSALVLACQMSPTVCDAIKHYRLTTQDFLQMQLDQCRAVEQLAGGPDRQLRAAAVKECLERKQAEGVPLDEAMQQCRDAIEMRGLRGQRVQEIDLVREIGEALKLSDKPRELLDHYVSRLTLSPHRFGGDVKVRPVDRRYDGKRADYVQALTAAAAEAPRGPLSPDALDRLSPPGAPPMSNDEVQRLSAMDPVERDLVVSMLASACALAEVTREAGDVQAALASARTLSTDPTVQGALEQESRRLDEEIRRLKEAFEMNERVTRARLRAEAVMEDHIIERMRLNTSDWRVRDQQAAAAYQTREWAKSCPTGK